MALYAVKQALNVPVALYWCKTGALEVVSNVSPSPKSHLNLTASNDERLLKVVGVFGAGETGEKLKSGVGASNTCMVNLAVSDKLQVFGLDAIKTIL